MKPNEERIEQFREYLISELDQAVDRTFYNLDAYDVITSQFLEQNLHVLVNDYEDVLKSYI